MPTPMQKTKTKTGVAVALVTFAIVSSVAAATIILKRNGGGSLGKSVRSVVSQALPATTPPVTTPPVITPPVTPGTTPAGVAASAPVCMTNIAATEFGYTEFTNTVYGGSIRISKSLPRWADASKNLHEEINLFGAPPPGMSITGKSCRVLKGAEGVTATLNGNTCTVNGKLPAGNIATVSYDVAYDVPQCPKKSVPVTGQPFAPPEYGERVFENGKYFCTYSNGDKDPVTNFISYGASVSNDVHFVDCQVEGYVPVVEHMDIPPSKVTVIAPKGKRFYSIKVPAGVKSLVIGQGSQDQRATVNSVVSMNPNKDDLEKEYDQAHDPTDIPNLCLSSLLKIKMHPNMTYDELHPLVKSIGFDCYMGEGTDMNAYKISTGYWLNRATTSGSSLTINDPKPGMYYYMLKNTSSERTAKIMTRVRFR